MGAAGQTARAALKFFPDDPISRDDDTAMDASGIKELELSESYDFLINTFATKSEPIRAVNVNTLDEVPDSSWFTNRIGVRDLPLTEIARGPNKFERLDATDWVVVRGKGPGGFHPGFVAEHPGDPGQVFQLEVDPVDHPQLATGAELIGTLVLRARVSRGGRLCDQGGSGQDQDLRQGHHPRRLRAAPLQPARPRCDSAAGGARP